MILNLIEVFGKPIETDTHSADLDVEHMELLTEGKEGLGVMVGAWNAFFLAATVWVLAIGLVVLVVYGFM